MKLCASRSILLLLGMLLMVAFPLRAAEAEEGDDENFVIASLLVASPGDVLYSCVGHTSLRMQCPEHNLDYCFSYEGESVEHQILRFFAGKLKMGMFAFATQEFVSLYEQEHRGIKEYRLNLPLEAKRRLWKVLDDKVMEGADLPYDYLKRGCTLSNTHFILQVLDTFSLQLAPWPEKYDRTIREIFVDEISSKAPWNLFYLQTIVGTKADGDVPPVEKMVIPTDLVELLQDATINGTPIITEAPVVLTTASLPQRHIWVTPMLLAVLLLLFSVANFWLRWSIIDWFLLTYQFILGALLSYLVFFSALPPTGWNWLLIPFNPLPMLFWLCLRPSRLGHLQASSDGTRYSVRWHWRKIFSTMFVAVLVGWILVMCFYPHQLTDWAHVVLATSLVPVFFRLRKKNN